MSGVKLPFGFVEVGDNPVEQVPCEMGAALGRELARFADQEEPPGAPPRCRDCAFRLGTIPNQCLGTVANAFKCAVEGVPFYCHHGIEQGNPTLLCRGWISLSSDETLAPIAAEIAASRGVAP